MADGSVVIEVNANVADAEKELAKLKKEIAKTQEIVSKQEAKKTPLARQAEEISAKMKEARAQVEMYGQQWRNGVIGADKQQSQAVETLNNLKAQYDGVVRKIDKIDEKLIPASTKLENMKINAGALEANMARTGTATRAMQTATAAAQKHMAVFAKRVAGLAKRVLIFSVILRALHGNLDFLKDAVKTSPEAMEAIADLKGAMLTLAQPLVDVIIPAFTKFVILLSKIISFVAQFVAILFGTTARQAKESAESLNNQMEALDGVGSAAKKAGKSVAGFDEINKLSSNVSGSNEIKPNFNISGEMSESQFRNILSLVKLIGAAFLTWKIAKTFSLDLKSILGLSVAIYSAISLVQFAIEAWTKGVDWENFIGMLGSVLGIAAGLYLAFGSTAAAIGLVVGGITMIIIGLHDAFESGWDLQNVIMTIVGLLVAGAGIGILTGSWIPLLIAAIASVILAITVGFGEGENLINGFKALLFGLKEFFVGIFTGDIARAIEGVNKIFVGLGGVWDSVINAIKNMFNSFLDWLDQKTGGRLHGIIEFIRGYFNGLIENIKTTFGNLLEAVKKVFTGIVQFISGVFTGDWDKAWEGVKDIFKGKINLMISFFEGMINAVIKALSFLISQINKIQFAVPEWVPGIGGKTISPNIKPINELKIPRLATGAVIPPNREFMAVLGDQKSGTNIETPLATMIEAFTTAMQSMGMGGGQTVVMQIDGREFGRFVNKYGVRESNRVGVNLAGVK